MFMGEFHHNLDDKSRLVIPSTFRFELGDKFIIACGLEKCLYVYSNDEWNKIVNKLNTLPFTKKDVRTFMRTFFSGAVIAELDKSGRALIPSNLLDYAGLSKECVIIGANDRLEIWDKNEWDAFLNESKEKLSDIAENLFMDVNL